MTKLKCNYWWKLLSLPLWECGLKWGGSKFIVFKTCHSPCGSVDWNKKQAEEDFNIQAGHSPCGSVDWNSNTLSAIFSSTVTPLVGVWIEILCGGLTPKYERRHSPCGSVDWNTQHRKSMSAVVRHSPCGSVDWNKYPFSVRNRSSVTPLVGVWIEIGQTAAKENLEYSHSPCGSVDWNVY